MGKQDKARRVYTTEFKAEVVAPAGKHVKLRFTGNPKKSGRTSVRVIFAQTEPR